MSDQPQNAQPQKPSPSQLNFPASPECGQWETLLADALDGAFDGGLRAEDEVFFSSHMATCAECAAMFEQARRGREWLEFLAPEPEVPAYLLDRILAETGTGKLETLQPGSLATAGGHVIAMPPVWQRPGFAGRMRRFAEPRLLMTAAMAFFSIALTMSMTGVRISGLKAEDLRPASLRSMVERRVMTASTPIIRYYDHLRFVYEVESRMRELRRSSETEQATPQKSQPGNSGGDGETHRKDGGTQLNPHEAPQQTVNPSVTQWSGEMQETRLEVPRTMQQFGHGKEIGSNIERKDLEVFPTPTEASVRVSSRMITGVSSMPDWSESCNA